MKNQKNRVIWFIVGIISLIIGFFILQSTVNNETPFDQAISEAFSTPSAKLVYLARPDCSWCQKAKPILNKTSKEYDFKYIYINTGKLNSKELESVLKKFNIDINEFGTPTFVVVKNGKVVDNNIGYMEESKLIEFLKNTEVIK